MLYHYTYRISNILLNKHYYGTRTSKNFLPTKDLGVKYFSSSSDEKFIQDQKENPQNYKYKIIRISDTRKQAMELEIKLHNKFDVGVNEHFYNRAKATSTSFDITGIKRPEHSEFMKGKCFHSKEFLRRCNLNFGDTSRENNSMYGTSRKGEENPFFGKRHSKETINRISKLKNEKVVLSDGTLSTQAKESGKKCSATKQSKEWKETKGAEANIKKQKTLNEIITYNNIYMTKKEMIALKSLESKIAKSDVYDIYHIEYGFIESLNRIDLRKKYGNIDKNKKENYKGKHPGAKGRLLKTNPYIIGLYTILKT